MGTVSCCSCVPVLHGLPIVEAFTALVVGLFVVSWSIRWRGVVFVPNFAGTLSASVFGYPEQCGWDAGMWAVFPTCLVGFLLA